jgi:hypothetical protein
MKHSRFATTIIFLFAVMAVHGQKVLVDERPVRAATTDFGPNEKYFVQFSSGLGCLVGKGDSRLDINDLRSTDFQIGIKFKRKISGLLSVWLEPSYHNAAFNLNQGNNKTLTDSLFWGNTHYKHEREHFAVEAFNLSGFLRFNFDTKRGNYLGYYLDLGAGADLYLGKEYLADDNKPDGSRATTNYTDLPYINNFGYNVFAKIGINWLALTFNYRLSHIFKPGYGLPEPPVYTVGLEINPYSH